VCVLSAALWAGTPLLAQMTNVGRISGTVSDTSQGVIAAARITVTNEATGLSRTATTNDQGFYVVTNLPVGSYTVAAEQLGFGKEEKTGNVLYADGRITVDFTLKPGRVTTSVEVTASAVGEAVNTVSGEVSHVVDQQQVQDLALNGRNYIQLASLMPGVALLNDDAMSQTTSLSATGQSVNGTRSNQNLLTVDGGFDLDSGSNGSQINNVGVDFIQEVSIKTSNFSAEYGRHAGGAIDVVTRHGGNEIHGAAFEFLRNDKFDAASYFSPRDPQGNPIKQKLRFNDFGYDLGGPILKNRLFFFAGQEWKRIRQDAAPVRRTLPTAAELQGDFSVARGSSSTGDLCVPGTFQGTTKPCGATTVNNNVASMITPEGRALVALYTAMQQQAASFSNAAAANNTIYQVSTPFNWREDLIRGDYAINPRQNVYLRYIHDSNNIFLPFGYSCSADLPTCPQNRLRPGTSYQLSHAWLVTPRLVNEATLSAAWNGQRVPPVGTSWKRSTYGFTFPQLFPSGGGRFRNSIPDIRMSGSCGTLPGTRTNRGCPSNVGGQSHSLLSPTTDITGSETLTWNRGQHTAKFGFVVIRNRKDQNSRSPYAGLITFNTGANNNRTTGNALADALIGNFQSYEEASDDPVGFFRYTQYHTFVDDTWKVTGHLSLELGLRYERHNPTYTQANNWSNFDPSLYDPAQAVTVTSNGLIDTSKGGNAFNGIIRAGSGVPQDELFRIPNGNSPSVLAVPAGAPRGLYPKQNAWAPRVGFAWAPFNKDTTAIRGGFGLFYNTEEGNMDFDELPNPPFAVQVNVLNGNLSNPSGGASPAAAPISVSAIDPHLKVPYTMQYSLTVEHQLPKGMLVSLGYVGNQGRHLVNKPDINQLPLTQLLAYAAMPSPRPNINSLRPYQGYSTINMFSSRGISNYNALQAYISKRKGRSTFTTSYTWSRTLTNAGSGSVRDGSAGNNIEFFALPSLSYGPADFDRTQIFVATYSFRTPDLKSWAVPLRQTLGGWELSGITRAQSGSPFTVTASPSGSALGARRADQVASARLSNPGPNGWFNPAAFQPAPDTRLGTAGYNSLRGPGYYDWDLSFRKIFSLWREGWNLRFQADLFNAFNRPNFHNPNASVTAGPYTTIDVSGPPREIQLSLKFTF
jgi:hypothetical protein